MEYHLYSRGISHGQSTLIARERREGVRGRNLGWSWRSSIIVSTPMSAEVIAQQATVTPLSSTWPPVSQSAPIRQRQTHHVASDFTSSSNTTAEGEDLRARSSYTCVRYGGTPKSVSAPCTYAGSIATCCAICAATCSIRMLA